jgi:hypothetical protein
MDITDSLAPTSDQLDAVELAASGPRTFVVESVSAGSVEQPIQVHLVGFPRVWRPSKGMRRVLAAGWGVDASKWAGRSVRLYCDPEVTFGRDKTGGTRIAAMSHLAKPLSVPMTVSRGKVVTFTVQPLVEEPAPRGMTAEDIAAATDVEALRAAWQTSTPALRKRIEARVAELTAPAAEPEPPVDRGDFDPTTDPTFGTGEA